MARNAAVAVACGEYIAFQDDDDLMPAHRIPLLLAALRAHAEAVMATGDYVMMDEQGEQTGSRWMPAPKSGASTAPRLYPDGCEAILWPRVPAVPHTTVFRAAEGERAGWLATEWG